MSAVAQRGSFRQAWRDRDGDAAVGDLGRNCAGSHDGDAACRMGLEMTVVPSAARSWSRVPRTFAQ